MQRPLFLCTLFALFLLLPAAALRIHRPLYLSSRGVESGTANFGPPHWSARAFRGRLLPVSPPEVCAPPMDARWDGAVLLVEGGECGRAAAAVHAGRLGAVGLLWVAAAGHSESAGEHAPEVNIPTEVIERRYADWMREALARNVTVEVSLGDSLNVLKYAV